MREKREYFDCACGACYMVITEEHTTPDGRLGCSGFLYLRPLCESIGSESEAAALAA